MDFAPIVVASAMIWTAVSALKLISAKLYHDLITLFVVVVVGVGVAFLLRGSDFAAGIDVGGIALVDLNVASTVLFGYGLSSFARVSYEVKKALDNGDNANEPKLLPTAQ